MDNETFEKILTPILERVFSFNFDDDSPDNIYLDRKERVGTTHNMTIHIYSNDHNPPHFHVFSKDKEVDAKFTIDSCELISGKISSKDLKKIQKFYSHPKVFLSMKAIWNKRI